MTYDEIYADSIANGCSPLLADLLASRQAPGSKGTEKAFMQDRNNNGDLDKMPAPMREELLNAAHSAGVSVSGKWWVSGRDDVLRICKERNLNCEGNVNYKAVDGLTRKQKQEATVNPNG
jgi:hypothetical protein